MLTIGNLNIASPLLLAPMAGISDLPYRLLNRAFGCGLAFTEMISSAALSVKSPGTLKMLSTGEKDRPLGVQLLGDDPDTLKKALDVVGRHACDIIDFNAACPAKKVAGKGKGAGLLREPAKLKDLLAVIVEHSPVPVTVKIRSGWDEASVNAVDVALRARDAGVAAIFIHGRTAMQRYRGTVDYGIINQVKKAVNIPVIASGDGLSPQLIKKLFDETGCDAVAVARGALGNPWIFPATEEYLKSGSVPPKPDSSETAQIMQRHLLSDVEFNGEKIAVLRFRKFFAWYTKGMGVKKLKAEAFRAVTHKQMLQLIDEVKQVQKSEVKSQNADSRPGCH